ncbi:MAG: hypothetical protein JSW52_09265 [Candidatus Coatesbacteria bacterium]|nr:MAG: hypothetical protein JSW52_09265 [Candidatus Coatesbacteria bacterium]
MLRFTTIFVLTLLAANGAFGHGGYVDLVPNGSVNSCNTCHLNFSFGQDFGDGDEQWTAALAAMDSDGDGYSNGVELLDPDGTWSVGDPDPGDPADVTNPDDPDDFPDDTGVDPASFGKTKSVFR